MHSGNSIKNEQSIENLIRFDIAYLLAQPIQVGRKEWESGVT